MKKAVRVLLVALTTATVLAMASAGLVGACGTLSDPVPCAQSTTPPPPDVE